MARRPRAAPFRIAEECSAEARLRRAAAGVEGLLQPVEEVEAARVLRVRMSGEADRPALEARSAAAAHMRRLSRKRRSEPKQRRRVYEGSGCAWPVPVWWSRLISITFLSPLHRYFANVFNPAPMDWRFAIFQRRNPVAPVLREEGEPHRTFGSLQVIAAEPWPPRLNSSRTSFLERPLLG